MSYLVSKFISPRPGSYEHKAIQKAIDEHPKVQLIGQVEGIRYFQVTSTRQLGPKYVVRYWEDNQHDVLESFDIVEKDGELVLKDTGHVKTEHGEFWIECFCPAGSPPLDPSKAKLICWLPRCCYHMASVLIYEAENFGEGLK